MDAQEASKPLRIRREGNFFAGFNPNNGHRLRWTINDGIDPTTDGYTKSLTPELTDVKITDWCDFGCRFCFVGGTKINTPDGEKNIEDIKSGDIVFAFDLQTGIRVTLPVGETYCRAYEGDMIDIELEDGTILSVTPEHEIFVKGRGWIQAGDLNENDEILHLTE